MAFYDLLPKFKQMEANNLKGLQAGLVVAQLPVEAEFKKTLKDKHLMENGLLCTISDAGIIAAKENYPVFIHYTEPLNTIYDAPRFFAVDVDQEYPRLVQLMPGDEWMTDQEYNTELLGKLGIVKVDDKFEDDWFNMKELADGTAAAHYMYIGNVTPAGIGG